VRSCSRAPEGRWGISPSKGVRVTLSVSVPVPQFREERMHTAWLTGLVRLSAHPRRLAAGSALLALALVATVAVARGGGVTQPIAFNHSKHTQDLQLECEFCHPRVRTGAHSGLPDLETCAACHQAPLGTSPEAARVTEYVTQQRPLVFVKLFRLPAHVYYTHRRHVGIAELECRRCHGDIALTIRPPRRPLVRISMEFCLDCHQRSVQTLDCIACHR